MRVIILMVLGFSSITLFAAESFSDKAAKVDALLIRNGVAIVCAWTASNDDVSTLEEILNLTIAALSDLRGRVKVSQPSLQTTAYRTAGLCVTVSRK